MIQGSLTVNGRNYQVDVPPMKPIKAIQPMKRLLDVLREDLSLTGTKEGCGEGECGACAVIMDGLLVLSCMTPICQALGKEITTIEGLAAGGKLHPMQEAFQEHGGAQCGICTPGMIVAAVYYRDHPDEADDLREALAGNLCRCTGYTRILESIKAALAKRKADRPQPSDS
jgi:aerobic carbon-monoxide dehydrogenase small subunit